MKNHNRNSKSVFWYFFTLLSFLTGLILYIILKQRSKAKIKITKDDKKKPVWVGKKEKKLNKQGVDIKILLTERQNLILDNIKKKGKIYPTDLRLLLPDVSTRTIRRDMTKLTELKLVEQRGSTKSTYYTYIK